MTDLRFQTRIELFFLVNDHQLIIKFFHRSWLDMIYMCIRTWRKNTMIHMRPFWSLWNYALPFDMSSYQLELSGYRKATLYLWYWQHAFYRINEINSEYNLTYGRYLWRTAHAWARLIVLWGTVYNHRIRPSSMEADSVRVGNLEIHNSQIWFGCKP